MTIFSRIHPQLFLPPLFWWGWGWRSPGFEVGESTLAACAMRNLHFSELGVGVPTKFLQFCLGLPPKFRNFGDFIQRRVNL